VQPQPLQQQLTPPYSSHPVLHESLSAGRINDLSAQSNTLNTSSAFLLSSAERERLADNILDKYRAIPPVSATPNSLLHGMRNPELIQGSSRIDADTESNAPYYDPTNITQCKAFLDAKRKLRLVLSSSANIPTNSNVRNNNTPSMIGNSSLTNNSNQNSENDQ
jgi:hypothetical protein